jgi:hypothetical protein
LQPAAHGFEELAFFDAGGSPYLKWQAQWNGAKPFFPTMPGSFRIGKSGEPTDRPYLTDDLGARAVAYLQGRTTNQKPFVLYYCPFAVHTPFQAPEKTVNHFQSKPQRGHLRRDNATYAAMLRHLDDSVGEIRATLEKTGLAKNTILIFTSDNGGVTYTSPPATDTYIAKGSPEGETWSPRFTYHGFQYVEVTGFDQEPPLDTIIGLVLHSDTPLTSGFECSDPVVNKVFQNAVWTQRANWVELPTDCPQRDERLGWTGDAQIYAASAAIHADVAAFFRKWLRELEEAVTKEGFYPSYAPYPFGHGGAVHGTAWSDAGVIVPHALWKATGDPSFFTGHWPAMTRYMEARKARDPELKGSAFGAPWGDWLNLSDPTPHPYVELAYFTKTSLMMADMADAQGLAGEVQKYRGWVETMRSNFRKDYFKRDFSIQPESQSAYVLALDCGLLTDTAERKKAGDRLAGLIRAKSGPNDHPHPSPVGIHCTQANGRPRRAVGAFRDHSGPRRHEVLGRWER